jgi:uncharacterized membrane protein
MLRAIRVFLFFLSLFLYFVRVDAFAALLCFLALLGTFHYVLWGRAMEMEAEAVEEESPVLQLDPLDMDEEPL